MQVLNGLLVILGVFAMAAEPAVIMNEVSTNPYRIDKAALQCLAINIYHEGRGEPKIDQEAIAQVVFNRVESKRFPNSVCDVVYQGGETKRNKCHFSWYCDGRSDNIHNAKVWDEVVTNATEFYLMRGRKEDITRGATHYHTRNVNPYWNKDMQYLVSFNDHIYYSDD